MLRCPCQVLVAIGYPKEAKMLLEVSIKSSPQSLYLLTRYRSTSPLIRQLLPRINGTHTPYTAPLQVFTFHFSYIRTITYTAAVFLKALYPQWKYLLLEDETLPLCCKNISLVICLQNQCNGLMKLRFCVVVNYVIIVLRCRYF